MVFAEPLDASKLKGKLHLITVGRLISSIYEDNVASIKSSGTRKVTITFKNRHSANKLIYDPLFEAHNLRYSIPAHHVTRQALMKMFPWILMKILIKELSLTKEFIKAQRLKRRVTSTDSSTHLTPSKTILLTFDYQNCPSDINLFYVR